MNKEDTRSRKNRRRLVRRGGQSSRGELGAQVRMGRGSVAIEVEAGGEEYEEGMQVRLQVGEKRVEEKDNTFDKIE